MRKSFSKTLQTQGIALPDVKIEAIKDYAYRDLKLMRSNFQARGMTVDLDDEAAIRMAEADKLVKVFEIDRSEAMLLLDLNQDDYDLFKELNPDGYQKYVSTFLSLPSLR
ncbi:hypothetical protein [Vibrio ouci]|uniref:Uncharacterized protein n=1 Tax=Vibrio ouci TaxID=2499078 RepID=A0A4Y8WAR6_9VIBR|nr:hypothetical protein [Vibrio ouci]TFH89703.1 hypothetical protein ELS82_20710 [Vibrio ouci]